MPHRSGRIVTHGCGWPEENLLKIECDLTVDVIISGAIN